jgi:hypothetical protein
MSHPWGAVGLLGIQEYMLGIKTLKPQHELIQVKPLDFEQQLKHVNGVLPTDRGDIAIRWTRSDTLFTMGITIPDNVTAHVYVPKSGTSGNMVIVDGIETEGTEEGNYISIGEFGSGMHTFERPAVNQIPEPVNDNLIRAHKMKMYPNPTSGNALVDLGKEYPDITIKVQDITGSTVREKSYTNTRFCNVELANTQEGIFFVTISDNKNEKVTLRLVKH